MSSPRGQQSQEVGNPGELNSMKDAILFDRQKRDSQYDETNRALQQFKQEVLTIKNDMVGKIKDHRSEYLQIFNQSEEERQRMERIKIDKMEADSHNQQGLIMTIQKRVDSDSLLRQRGEDDIKKYVEIKFTGIVE